MVAPNIAAYYDGWQLLNQRLIDTVGALTAEQLALRPAPELWPIWAVTAHLAGARVYWLSAILKEPGAEQTPFVDPAGEGWEDDLTRPRSPSELIFALASSWQLVQRCLDRWTPPMLQEEFRRERPDQVQMHTRQSVLMRLITHDAYHGGEVSLILGMHGLKELDLWTGRARVLPAAR
jgi:uncharacterized damage-inducible protein DinB